MSKRETLLEINNLRAFAEKNWRAKKSARERCEFSD